MTAGREVVHPNLEDRLIIFCSASAHKGEQILITEATFDLWDGGAGFASALQIQNFSLTKHYWETNILQGAPSKLSLNSLLKKRDARLFEDVEIHSTFKCSCPLNLEIKTANITRIIREAIWKQVVEYRGGNLYANLKDVIVQASSN